MQGLARSAAHIIHILSQRNSSLKLFIVNKEKNINTNEITHLCDTLKQKVPWHSSSIS